MELTGLNDYMLFRYDNNGKLITDTEQGGLKSNIGKDGIFRVDLQSSFGATQANITGLAPTAQKVYGSNAVAEQHIGAVNPQVALAANDIPHIIYDLLAGLTKDDKVKGGYAHKENVMVHGGLIVHSHNDNRDIDFFMAFPFGLYTPGEMNLQTNNENPTIVHDALTFAAQARGADNLLYEKFYSDEQGFDFDSMVNYIADIGANATTDPTTKDSSKVLNTGDTSSDKTSTPAA